MSNFFDPKTGKQSPKQGLIAGFEPGFLHAVSEGFVEGHYIFHKFGTLSYSTPADTSFKPVATAKVYQTPTAPVNLEVVSDDNINDIPLGDGARSVKIIGLKSPSSVAEDTEIVALSGTTAVPLVDQWWRIYAIEVETSGVYATQVQPSHNSTITVQESGGGTIWGSIALASGFGFGQSEIAVLTTPANTKAHMLSYTIDVSNTNKAGDIVLFVRENADVVVEPFTGVLRALAVHKNVGAGSDVAIKPKSMMDTIIGPADIGFMAEGDADFEIDIDFEILCIQQ